MKIAVFHPQFHNGGLDRVVVRLTRGFVQHGHEVDLLTASTSGSAYEEIDAGVNRVRLKSARLPAIPGLVSAGSWLSLFSIPSLVCYLRHNRPDVLFAASSLNGAVLANKMSMTGTNLVLRVAQHQSGSTVHDTYATARLVPFVRRQLFKRASAVLTNSEAGAADLRESLSLSAERVAVIHNPAADPQIADKAKESVDHRWLNDGNIPLAVSASRLDALKDVPTMLRALAKVNETTPCRLIVLGEGADRQKLQALARELGVEDSVDLHGFVSNPWAFMARADLYVTTSLLEGSPNALIEAMYLGTPVVATDCPTGPREILDDGALGKLVPMGDVEAIAAAWLDVITDRESARGVADEALKHVGRYEFDAVVSQYLDLFAGLKAGRQ